MPKPKTLENKFCPMTKDNCRTDCVWCYQETELSEDGISEWFNCAVNLIAEAGYRDCEFEDDYA